MIFSDKKNLPSWRVEFQVPAIKNRFLHIDLKGPKIPYRVFSHLLEQIARWGINGVIVEYEHRLPCLPLPHQFPEYERYTEKEIRTLIEKAKALGIEWIPLVQTFGHVEYLSRLKGTEILFENPQYPSQLCPSKKEVRKYIENLIDIICMLHPESKYIHVGQDETRQLGLCRQCSNKMKKLGGKIELYLEHVNFVWNEVFKHNKIPMAWADMFTGSGRLDLVRDIDKRVILVPWDYQSTGNTSKFVFYKGFRPAKKQFYHQYQEPGTILQFPENGKFFEDLDEKEITQIGMDENTGYPLSFSQLRLMATTGRKFYGACGLYMSADRAFHPDYIRGLLNPAGMCRAIIDYNGEGIIGTMWARGHSFAPINAPWTLALYNIVQFARVSWTGKTRPEDFRKATKEIASELDMPEIFDGQWTLDDILWMVSAKNSLNENVFETIEKEKISGCFGEGLKRCLSAELLQHQLRYIIEEARWWYSTRDQMPVEMKKNMKKRMQLIMVKIEKLKKSLKKYYLKWVGDEKSFLLWWENLFTPDVTFVQCILKKFK
ncbi:MAG: family 20 glycosylhydrolase [Candidatus Omnitrophica bacterium]|nr:family 20 glycosylhydrolase [Candidatus Omnitrophota bacterium]